MIFVLLGEMGSGKSSILDGVCKEMPELKRVVSCTTRPQRDGEVHGVDYYFVTDHDYSYMAHKKKLIAPTSFVAASGVRFSYGIPTTQFESANDSILIADHKGFYDLRKERKNGKEFYFIYIDIDQTLQFARLTDRGDDNIEINRRVEADKEAYSIVAKKVDHVVPNIGNIEIAIAKVCDIIQRSQK